MILELKRTPGIYLVGFMGSGKSTVGAQLAHRIGWTFADLDNDIEAAAGRPIAAIFEDDGEPEFRRRESQALAARVRNVRSGCPLVLALGGGAFACEGNRDLLRGSGVSVWIDCPVDILWERVRHFQHRPLARDPAAFRKLFAARAESYALADHRVPSGRADSSHVVDAILALPVFR